MIRVFLDASVLFSASYSATGSSREIIRQAIWGDLAIVVSRYVLEEVRRNLATKVPGVLEAYEELLVLLSPEIAKDPTLSELREVATYINLKDAPIIAAAIKAHVDYLVSWDRKHFIDDPQVAARSGLAIVTPDELVSVLRGAGRS